MTRILVPNGPNLYLPVGGGEIEYGVESLQEMEQKAGDNAFRGLGAVAAKTLFSR